MKILDCAQGSQQWIEARCAIPTASEFDNLISPKGEIRKGQTPKTYLARKLAEKWGGPLPGFGSFVTDNGEILEGEAIPWAEFEFGWKVRRVGFITTDDDRVGCSPDGIIGDDVGLEIKCPQSPAHVSYLLSGELPADYIAQVQGSLFVTGFNLWKFLSYRRHYPPLILNITPDPLFQEKLAAALDQFNTYFDDAWAQLIKMNGGPPPKRMPMKFSDEVSSGPAFADDIVP